MFLHKRHLCHRKNNLKVRQICFHLAHDAKEGQYERIRKVQQDINLLTNSDYLEFQVVGIIPFLRRSVAFTQMPPAVINGKKIVLPILLPRAWRVPLIRIVNDLIATTCGAVIGFFLRPDYCVGETHSSFAAVRGVRMASPKTKVIFDLHGAYPEEIEYNYGPRQWVRRLVAYEDKNEKRILDCASFLISQSDAMFKHLERKHQRRSKREVLYQCGVDTDLFQFDRKFREDVRKELAIAEDDIVFVYLGGMHRWQLVESVFQIINVLLIQNPRLRIKMLVMTNEPAGSVEQNAVRHGIPRESVRVLSVQHLAVPRYLSACDFGFLLREDIVLNRVACPTKLGEYLACGLPVITSDIALQWPWTNGENDAVCIVDHNSPDKAATIISSFLEERHWHIGIQTKLACREVALSKLSQKQDTDNLSFLLESESK